MKQICQPCHNIMLINFVAGRFCLIYYPSTSTLSSGTLPCPFLSNRNRQDKRTSSLSAMSPVQIWLRLNLLIPAGFSHHNSNYKLLVNTSVHTYLVCDFEMKCYYICGTPQRPQYSDTGSILIDRGMADHCQGR